jgi:hypothetical protein
MKQIYQIYKKLLNLLFKSEPIKQIESDQIVYDKDLGTISFSITSNSDIDISCTIPDLENSNSDDIIKLSEKYAELLLLLNRGLFKKQILKILKQHDTENIKSKLFIDNIIYFYPLLNEELNKAVKANRPLVRPSSVFKL